MTFSRRRSLKSGWTAASSACVGSIDASMGIPGAILMHLVSRWQDLIACHRAACWAVRAWSTSSTAAWAPLPPRIRISVLMSSTASADPAKHFEGVPHRTVETTAALLQLPAYKEVIRLGNDGGCGAAMLTGKSVAVPYVSAFTGALGITQAIRIASGKA